MSLPRGIRNNNPCNLVRTGIAWKGKISQGTDPRFEQFETAELGLRAAALTLKSHWRRGARTINELIRRWAPPTENNTAKYIEAVVRHMGWPADKPMLLTRRTAARLLWAIVGFENGKAYSNHYPVSMYVRALDLAGAPVAWDEEW